MRAYTPVCFDAGTDLSKAHHALNRPGIKSVDLVMGPYDAIVTAEAANYAQLAEVARAVRGCPGIRESMTCPVA